MHLVVCVCVCVCVMTPSSFHILSISILLSPSWCSYTKGKHNNLTKCLHNNKRQEDEENPYQIWKLGRCGPCGQVIYNTFYITSHFLTLSFKKVFLLQPLFLVPHQIEKTSSLWKSENVIALREKQNVWLCTPLTLILSGAHTGTQ